MAMVDDDEERVRGLNPILEAMRVNRATIPPWTEHMMHGAAVANTEGVAARRTALEEQQRQRKLAGRQPEPW